jgi:TrmH family RNA methyltransferase
MQDHLQEPLSLTKLKSLIQANKSGAGELVIVEGLHAVKHALRFGAKPKLILAKNKEQLLKLSQKLCPDITSKLKRYSTELEDFDKLTTSKIRTGVIAIFPKPANVIPAQAGIHATQNPKDVILSAAQRSRRIPRYTFTILLDNPCDLNNIGAVIRVCAAAGIKDLIITGDSNPWNANAIRAAAGLQFALNIICTKTLESVIPPACNTNLQKSNEVDTLSLDPKSVIPAQAGIYAAQKLSLKDNNLPLISFDERGQELTPKLKKQIPPNSILIFGSERDGISKELKLNSDLIIRLPMQAGVSSMNLATSVAAALYSLKI